MPKQLAFLLAAIFLLAPITAAQEQVSGIEATLQQVLALADQEKIDEAVALLEEARAAGETDPRLFSTLGALYLESGRAGEALELLRPRADLPEADPALLYNAGRAAAATGDLALATRYLERSLELSAVSPAARELGFLKMQQGELFDSYLLLRPWSRLRPNDALARLAAASCAVALGRTAEADELLAELPPDDPRVKILQARTYLLKEDGWGALATVQPLADEPPAGLESQISSVLADAYLRIGQVDTAIAQLEGKAGDDPDLVRLLSRALYEKGELQQALATLQPVADGIRAATTAESPVAERILGHEVTLDYGKMLAQAKRHQEAIPYLELATRLEPDAVDAWDELARSAEALGRAEETERARAMSRTLRGAIGPQTGFASAEAAADAVGARLRRALRLSTEGNLAAALSIVRQEQILAPGDVRPRILEARLLSGQGRLAEAREVADLAVQMAPDSADAYYIRGIIRLDLGLSGPAEQDLRQAIFLAPQHIAAMNDLAVLLMVRGNQDEARTLLQQVLDLSPEDPVARENLEALDRDSGG